MTATDGVHQLDIGMNIPVAFEDNLASYGVGEVASIHVGFIVPSIRSEIGQTAKAICRIYWTTNSLGGLNTKPIRYRVDIYPV